MMRVCFVSLSLLALPLIPAGTAAAQSFGYLPPDAAIDAALEAAPELEAARAEMRAAEAEARVILRGEHDLTVSAAVDQRRVDREGDFTEYGGQVSKGIRLPAKTRVDRDLAAVTQALAHNRFEDTRHRLSLELAGLVTGVIEARGQRVLAQRDEDTYRQDVSALERRYALKDAALLEVQQARAALLRAQAQVSTTEGALRLAEDALARRFPGLLAANAAFDAPRAPSRPYEQWPDLMLSRSHELAIVKQEAELARLRARRAGLDRVADPVVGARLFNERGGQETGLGVFVSVPLGQGRREDIYQAGLSSAAAAAARLRQAERDLQLSAQSDVIDAQSRLDAWARLKDAAEMAQTSVETLGKGYRLGEIALGDLLNARRQAQEAARAELSARRDAHMALLRLYLDAHELWLREEE